MQNCAKISSSMSKHNILRKKLKKNKSLWKLWKLSDKMAFNVTWKVKKEKNTKIKFKHIYDVRVGYATKVISKDCFFFKFDKL